ncbi:MAG: PAS-domain containing protein [Pseudolabrys sp.]|nr:PAS-domain containing protein [Pseudolabrys sp.]
MPETIRVNGRRRSCPRRGRFLAAALGLSLSAAAANAAPLDAPLATLASLSQQEITALTLTLGLLCFSVVTAIMLVRNRARAAQAESAARDAMSDLRATYERTRALLMSEPQVLIAWDSGGAPEIVGDGNLIVPGAASDGVLAFASWLEPGVAADLDAAVAHLRSEGRGFTMALQSLAGQPIEATGRAVGGRAVLRLREVSGSKADLAELSTRYQHVLTTLGSLRDLVDALPTPVWMRDDSGLLTFVNTAYVRAVGARDASEAVDNAIEMFDRAERDRLDAARDGKTSFTGRLHAVAGQQRRLFDVVDAPSGRGRAGIALDVTDVAAMRSELARLTEAHRRILDRLATGVAVFGADHRLAFYNVAYRALWDLDAGYLDQGPTDGGLLDRLREANRLPEQANFRQWKQQLHEGYRALDPAEQMWHLPDGRALRVVVVPNPQGGVTYLFEDVTESLEQNRRYASLIKVQSETLDHLSEAVAVFASDGRMRLHNPAFETMWKLTPDALAQRPHIEAVAAWCQAQHDDPALWRQLRTAVTGIDNRAATTATIERRDGSVIDWAAVPLPDGATMLTFKDVTDTVNVERALRERNEALVAADSVKIDFVHHVSYELRSPLTNIIGFAHFLNDPAFGPLTEKQREYLSYITVSTNSLLAIINNILDLATIDAGAMTLNLGAVDIRATMEAAAEGIQDRLVANAIQLDIQAPASIGSFTADASRVRQVLFNLLSNAAGFSPPNDIIVLKAERRPDAIVFSVTDRGPGIPDDFKGKAFDWFETRSQGSEHRGAGLGLTLVRSFVELHGGTVTLDSTVGRGTTVTCSFPLEQAAQPLPRQSAA